MKCPLNRLKYTHPIISCRSSRKKLEEELMEVNNQIAELNSEAKETAVQQLEEEIRVCKNMIKCTVCSDRPKEVKSGQLIQMFLAYFNNSSS